MKHEISFKGILIAFAMVGIVCFILGFLSGCFPPERKQFWKDVQVQESIDPDYGAGKKP